MAWSVGQGAIIGVCVNIGVLVHLILYTFRIFPLSFSQQEPQFEFFCLSFSNRNDFMYKLENQA